MHVSVRYLLPHVRFHTVHLHVLLFLLQRIHKQKTISSFKFSVEESRLCQYLYPPAPSFLQIPHWKYFLSELSLKVKMKHTVPTLLEVVGSSNNSQWGTKVSQQIDMLLASEVTPDGRLKVDSTTSQLRLSLIHI